MRCELLSRTIEVTSAVSVQAIIVGAVAGALLLILGVVAIYMACKHRHRVTQLFVSFIRGETLLTLKILMELVDISGDSNPLPRFLRLHSPSG
jgi:ABC-type amino acid transport system permease subunit